MLHGHQIYTLKVVGDWVVELPVLILPFPSYPDVEKVEVHRLVRGQPPLPVRGVVSHVTLAKGRGGGG
jgi:hypothetical protein